MQQVLSSPLGFAGLPPQGRKPSRQPCSDVSHNAQRLGHPASGPEPGQDGTRGRTGPHPSLSNRRCRHGVHHSHARLRGEPKPPETHRPPPGPSEGRICGTEHGPPAEDPQLSAPQAHAAPTSTPPTTQIGPHGASNHTRVPKGRALSSAAALRSPGHRGHQAVLSQSETPRKQNSPEARGLPE